METSQDNNTPEEANQSPTLSKKGKKKLEKLILKEQRASQIRQANNSVSNEQNKTAFDIEQDDYGYLPLNRSEVTTSRVWTEISSLTSTQEGDSVWIRARVASNRGKGSLCFLVIRQKESSVQCILDAKRSSKGMIQWATSVPLESVLDIFGEIKVPDMPIISTSQSVEIEVKKMFCTSKSSPELPFQLKDINRVITDDSEEVINVNQETRLDNRIIDLRGTANQEIFKLQSEVCHIFRSFLRDHDFLEIHTPKLLGGASEGGSTCFSFKYFEQIAFLAQSPQLYKQMAINSDMNRVFEIGPVFRAENSNTHRHLTEFISLDLEMTFKDHYFEVVDFIDSLLKFIFSQLAENFSKEIETINKYHPTTQFKWLSTTPKFLFTEGLQLLKNHGCNDIPDDISDYDISTEKEKLLGKIIKEKYDTDYYILYRYPTKSRAFYSMPCADDNTFCNSYDFFIRGEEILSGAQRIHDSDLLREASTNHGIDPNSLSFYIDSFKYGSYPHAGCGIGMERLIMLFLGMPNIRKLSLFPRDPKRISP